MADRPLPSFPALLAYSEPEKKKKKRIVGKKAKADVLFELIESGNTSRFAEMAKNFNPHELMKCRSGDGGALLHAAVEHGNKEIVTFLVKYVGCNVNVQNTNCSTPLHRAIHNNKLECARFLLQQAVIDCAIQDSDGNSFLHFLSAVKMNSTTMNEYISLLRLALDKGASFFCHNNKGEYPLHFAAASGQSWALSFALQKFVNPDVMTKNRDTPLHYAIRSGNMTEAETLLRNGADPYYINKDGELPVDLLRKDLKLSRKGKFSKLLYYSPLLDSRKNFSQATFPDKLSEDKESMTLLHYACLFGAFSVAQKICSTPKFAPAASHQNLNGNTPLHFLCRFVPTSKDEVTDYLVTLKMLMDVMKKNIFLPNCRKESPLHVSILTRNHISAKHLIEKGVHVNSLNLYGETPLHYAAICGGNLRLVKLLLTYGANRSIYSNRPNVQPERPVDIAIQTSQLPLIFLLHNASTPPLSYSRPLLARQNDTTGAHRITSFTATTSWTSTHPLPVSQMELIQKYQVLEMIGQGSYAVVHRALDRRSSEEYALKIFRSSKNTKAIWNEVDILKKCHHPNIVSYQGFYGDDTQMFVVMDYCQLGSLDAIRKMVTFSEPAISEIMKSVLLGLEYLHQMGLIHCDLKGQNILLKDKGIVQIADFGVAKKFSQLEGLETLAGTPLFMAPEVMESNSWSGKADIWAFGVTTYAAAESNPPHAHVGKMLDLYCKIVNGDPPRLLNGRWSEVFCQFVEYSCQKQPEIRPTAAQLLKHPFIISNERKGKLHLDNIIRRYLSLSQPRTYSEGGRIDDLADRLEDVRKRLGKIEGAVVDGYLDKTSQQLIDQTNSWIRQVECEINVAKMQNTFNSTNSIMSEWSTKSELWTIWVKFEQMESVPIEKCDPAATLHHLKNVIRHHPEFRNLQQLSLTKISILTKEGKRLEPSMVLSQCVKNGGTLQVHLLDGTIEQNSNESSPPHHFHRRASKSPPSAKSQLEAVHAVNAKKLDNMHRVRDILLQMNDGDGGRHDNDDSVEYERDSPLITDVAVLGNPQTEEQAGDGWKSI